MTVPKVKLSSRLPDGEHNGLLALHKRLAGATAPDMLVCVAFLDRVKDEHLDDTGEDVPVMRVRRIEALSDAEDANAVANLLLREFERRSGKAVLPLELENDLRAIVDAGIEPEEPGEPSE